MHVGIDIEEISRFEKIITKNPSVLGKMFVKSELDYATKKSSAQTLAGLWCAKEAVTKALFSAGIQIVIQDVVVSHDFNGVPFVAEIRSTNQVDIKELKISISHASNFATAVCFFADTQNAVIR